VTNRYLLELTPEEVHVLNALVIFYCSTSTEKKLLAMLCIKLARERIGDDEKEFLDKVQRLIESVVEQGDYCV
jgi:hypothetical protein